jgi:hypothetical protein
MNDEDLVTMNETTRIHPLDYFGFEENGKTWAFESSTLFAWSLRSEIPNNPYTKTPLSVETRKRLFRLWSYRIRHRQGPNVFSVVETCRFLARIFQDNGFADVGTRSFLDITKPTWIRFYRVLQQELLTTYSETNTIRRRGVIVCRRMEHFVPTASSQAYCAIACTHLLRLMAVPRDPYLLCFSALSCFYRV